MTRATAAIATADWDHFRAFLRRRHLEDGAEGRWRPAAPPARRDSPWSLDWEAVRGVAFPKRGLPRPRIGLARVVGDPRKLLLDLAAPGGSLVPPRSTRNVGCPTSFINRSRWLRSDKRLRPGRSSWAPSEAACRGARLDDDRPALAERTPRDRATREPRFGHTAMRPGQRWPATASRPSACRSAPIRAAGPGACRSPAMRGIPFEVTCDRPMALSRGGWVDAWRRARGNRGCLHALPA